jgi:hypothetical protein
MAEASVSKSYVIYRSGRDGRMHHGFTTVGPFELSAVSFQHSARKQPEASRIHFGWGLRGALFVPRR